MTAELAHIPDPAGGSRDFERTPPQNIEAEQCVLGGMLLSKDAIADVVETVRALDFYRPAHATIYEAVIDLYGRGDPADAITVAAELTKRGEIARVGGAPYLHTLVSTVPTAASAGYYARIVMEQAVLRRLVTAGTRIVQMGYSNAGDVDDVVDRAQQAIFDVTERRTADDYIPLGELLQPTLDEIEAIGSRDGSLAGVPTGFAELDALTNGMHPGNLIILAARPSIGKSTMGLDLARSAAIRHQLPTVIFSLEMSRSEITMRLLSAEARVHLQNMRTGRMSDDDWQRLARRMGEVAEAPLYIDDSPNLTMMEIRAKARRLRQRHNLQLVIVDYMQLMSSPKRVENRQQEVSEISRSMKLLAKELEVPVIAISQLNRSPEQRADKKPQLSDLRESGCLTADARVLRADNGAEVTMGELLLTGERNIPVWTLNEDLKIVRGTMTHVFPSGTKEVFELRLASGRRVKASANHPFLTYDGWRRLDELAEGSRIAVPRRVPAPSTTVAMPEAEIVMLAHLIGDGCFAPRQPLHYTSADEANLQAVEEAAAHWGITPRRVPQQTWSHVYLPSPYRLTHGKHNPIAGWLASFGLYGKRSPEKFVPAPVFALPDEQVALFLRHLWATDGSAGVYGGNPHIYYASTSSRLVEDVRLLLARFQILTRVITTKKAGYRNGFQLDIMGAENMRRFADRIGIHGERAAGLAKVRARIDQVVKQPYTDTVPAGVLERVLNSAAARGLTLHGAVRESGMTPGTVTKTRAPQRWRLERLAATLEDEWLLKHARSDVSWDRVVAIEPLGSEPVFDATVLETHNFIANGITLKNSLEQDADVVILLYREDAFEKESPRAGEADFIVAKHRNGPTGTVTVAFQGHYSRFVDMQPSG